MKDRACEGKASRRPCLLHTTRILPTKEQEVAIIDVHVSCYVCDSLGISYCPRDWLMIRNDQK